MFAMRALRRAGTLFRAVRAGVSLESIELVGAEAGAELAGGELAGGAARGGAELAGGAARGGAELAGGAARGGAESLGGVARGGAESLGGVARGGAESLGRAGVELTGGAAGTGAGNILSPRESLKVLVRLESEAARGGADLASGAARGGAESLGGAISPPPPKPPRLIWPARGGAGSLGESFDNGVRTFVENALKPGLEGVADIISDLQTGVVQGGKLEVAGLSFETLGASLTKGGKRLMELASLLRRGKITFSLNEAGDVIVSEVAGGEISVTGDMIDIDFRVVAAKSLKARLAKLSADGVTTPEFLQKLLSPSLARANEDLELLETLQSQIMIGDSAEEIAGTLEILGREFAAVGAEIAEVGSVLRNFGGPLPGGGAFLGVDKIWGGAKSLGGAARGGADALGGAARGGADALGESFNNGVRTFVSKTLKQDLEGIYKTAENFQRSLKELPSATRAGIAVGSRFEAAGWNFETFGASLTKSGKRLMELASLLRRGNVTLVEGGKVVATGGAGGEIVVTGEAIGTDLLSEISEAAKLLRSRLAKLPTKSMDVSEFQEGLVLPLLERISANADLLATLDGQLAAGMSIEEIANTIELIGMRYAQIGAEVTEMGSVLSQIGFRTVAEWLMGTDAESLMGAGRDIQFVGAGVGKGPIIGAVVIGGAVLVGGAITAAVLLSRSDMPEVEREVVSSPPTGSDPEGDDYASNKETKGVVLPGEIVKGDISASGDVDWFKVELTGGKNYLIYLVGSENPDGETLLNPLIQGIYDSNGEFIAGTTRSGEGYALLEAIPYRSGTFYIAVASAENGDGETGTGTYELFVQDDDMPANTSTDGVLEVAAPVHGEITTDSDIDWFKVHLIGGVGYKFSLEGASTREGTLGNPYLRGLYDANGHLVEGTEDVSGGVGKNALVSFTPDTTGYYFVAVDSLGTSKSDYTGTYKLEMTELGDDYPDTVHTSGEIDVGSSTTGEITREGDMDWFRVALEIGRTYEINLEGVSTGMGTLRNPYLHGVYDTDGNLVSDSSNDDGGTGKNARLLFTPKARGYFYISVANADTDEGGTYKVSIEDRSPPDLKDGDDYPAGLHTTGNLESGSPVKGKLGLVDDVDWFRVYLEAHRSYIFNLEGQDTGKGSLRNPLLSGIYDRAGNKIDGSSNDDGGYYRNARVGFVPDVSGYYYVAVASSDKGKDFQRLGSYELSVVGDDYLDNTETSAEVEVGDSIRSSINTLDDVDWIKVHLKEGASYGILIEGQKDSEGVPFDCPLLYGMYDSDGDRVSGTFQGIRQDGSVYLEVPIVEEGDYYIAVASGMRMLVDPEAYATAHGLSSRLVWSVRDGYVKPRPKGYRWHYEGDYTLTIKDTGDDHPNFLFTSGTVDVGSSVTGEISRHGDIDWFKVHLKAGEHYTIEITGEGTDGALVDPDLYGIYDKDGNYIGYTYKTGGGTGKTVHFEFSVSNDGGEGEYYIAVGSGSYYSGENTGKYRLYVTDEDDYTSDTHTTADLELQHTVHGLIERPYDVDWLRIHVEEGSSYLITLDNVGDLVPDIKGIYDEHGDAYKDTGEYGSDTWKEVHGAIRWFTASYTGDVYVGVGASNRPGADSEHHGTGEYSIYYDYLSHGSLTDNLDLETTADVHGSL